MGDRELGVKYSAVKDGSTSGTLATAEMTEVEPYNSPSQSKNLNVNRYATKKTIAQGMLDIALLTANASQLKYVLQAGNKHPFYTLMLTLISISIVLQITAGVCMLVLGSLNMNKPKNQNLANILNNVVTIKVFIIAVLNIIISSFGIEHVVQEEANYYARSQRLLQSQPDTLQLNPDATYSQHQHPHSGKVSFDDERL